MEQHYIYLVCSATPYLMGKMIRRVTGEQYNHISVALDEDLDRMYGFSRRFYRTPLYGGFNHESRARYRIGDRNAQIQVYRIPVTQEQHAALTARMADMYSRKHHYLYNHLSALCTLLHTPVKARDAYTCVEFGVEILHSIGISVTPGIYYSIADVQKVLHPYLFCTGPMIPSDKMEAGYFETAPLPYFFITLRDMLRLIPRICAK